MRMSKMALIVIDVQEGIVGAPRIHDAEGVMNRIRTLQDRARDERVPVLHVQHDGPKGHRAEKGTKGWNIHPAVRPRPGEPVIHKQASDAFFETSLQRELSNLDVSRIVIAGCMTQYCVDTTCRRAVTLGLDVTLVSDAHTTEDEGGLTAFQIIGHHNTLLDGFAAGGHEVTITRADSVSFLG
jgi:nicotinamidase-related amidase